MDFRGDAAVFYGNVGAVARCIGCLRSVLFWVYTLVFEVWGLEFAFNV